MKGIKVIDVGSNPEETQFGTCELCFSYGVADNPYMVLEFPDGTQVTSVAPNIIHEMTLAQKTMFVLGASWLSYEGGGK